MLSDLRLTLRTLAKSPAFVIVAVFTLTLGIGVNAAMFGIVNAVLLRGLPFPEQDRLYRVHSQKLPDRHQWTVSHADFADLRAAQTSFETLAAYTSHTFNLANPGNDPERVFGTRISPAGVPLLRARAALGRWFHPDEEKPDAPAVVVLSHTLWQTRFKADPGVVGQPLKVSGEWATIVGVAAEGFHFPEIAQLWLPLRLHPDERRDDRSLVVFGRLKAAVSPQQAQADVAAIARRLALAHQDTNKDVGATVELLFHTFVDDETRQLVEVMFGAVGLVLLIACANVANLLLSRSAVRQKEVAVRSALGASRTQIIRLLLLETLALCIVGAALGLPLAHGLMTLLRRHLAGQVIPYWMVFDLDATGVAYIIGLSMLSCLVAGIWPAWHTSRTDVNAILKEGGRGATSFSLSRFTRALLVVEVVLSAVLLVLAGLTIRSVIRMQLAPLGYRSDGVFSNRIALSGPLYDDRQKQLTFFRELLRRLPERPEVAGVAIASIAPTWFSREQVELDGRPRGDPKVTGLWPQYASRAAVSGNYFDTLGIRLERGRTFDERDLRSAPRVAIVSTKFAERHWPREDAIGKRFVYGWGLDVKPDDWITVIGIVSPIVQGFQREMIDVPQTYVPYTQEAELRYLNVFTRARAGDPARLAPIVRETVRAIDADQPIYWAKPLTSLVSDARFFKELVAWMFGIFGFVALLLATIGLYGVMSYSVSQRTQEIGVRMALGAEPRTVIAMILREGGLRLAVGLALGLLVAFFSGRLVAFVLYGVEPHDGPVFLATILTLTAAGLVACLLPALRAVRVNPIEALRCE